MQRYRPLTTNQQATIERNAPIVVHSQMDLIGVEMGENGLCITEFIAEEPIVHLEIVIPTAH